MNLPSKPSNIREEISVGLESVQRTDRQLLVPAANKPGDDEIAMTFGDVGD
jgi:hypothetical protein